MRRLIAGRCSSAKSLQFGNVVQERDVIAKLAQVLASIRRQCCQVCQRDGLAHAGLTYHDQMCTTSQRRPQAQRRCLVGRRKFRPALGGRAPSSSRRPRKPPAPPVRLWPVVPEGLAPPVRPAGQTEARQDAWTAPCVASPGDDPIRRRSFGACPVASRRDRTS